MSCQSINNLIFLKDEELSKQEQNKLHNHLEVCSNCRIKRKEIEKAFGIISKLNLYEPLEDNPFILEENIMSMVEKSVNLKPAFPELVDRIADFLYHTGIRYAMIVTLLIIFGFYFWEESIMIAGISKIEENSSKRFNKELISSGVFEDQVKLLNAVPEIYNLINGKKDFAMLSDKWIVINKRELKSVLELYNKLVSFKSQLPSEYETEYPLLAKFINRDLNEETLDQLMNQKNEILNELNKFLKDGGNRNEVKK
jgi:hypothetical protein